MGCTNRWMAAGMVMLLAAPFGPSVRAADYEGVEVEDGGTIVGVVRFDGEAPKRRRLAIAGSDEICRKKPIPSENLVVAKEGKTIRWAIASIKKIKKGKPFPEQDEANPYVLDQVGCRFRPHVVVVPKDRPLKIRNSDGILHNVHLYAKKNEPFNRSMPGARVKELVVTFDWAEIIRVGCDVHKWMSGWVVVAKHPYTAVTGKDGAFRLDNIPAGTYKVQVWHEKLGKQTKEVTVNAGEEVQLDFAFKAK